MRELSVTEANFAGLLGSIIGVAAGIVAVILLVKDGAISGSAYLLEDFLLTSWPVLQGLGFARLFRDRKSVV